MATTLLTESAQLAQARAIPYEIGENESFAAWVYYRDNQLDKAMASFEESLSIFQHENETEGIAFSCYGLGLIAVKRANTGLAASHLHESLRRWQLRGHKHHIGAALSGLGRLELAQGNPQAAALHFRASLTLYKEMVDKQGAATALEGFAQSLPATDFAARLFGAAAALRQTIGAPIPPVDQSDYTQSINTLRTTLGDQTFAVHWAEGGTLSYEQAITLALTTG